ncbi:MAG: hypothetical protein PF795_13490 [Kiritimatiellae bacterium]|jgi:glutathione synthase/RimK-type ligase-like ATP-grasp enzyme|nr:hypothetical protein [Kiritimatiellia bacterium]
MPKILLVDTNRAAYPIYQALITAGHDVWVVGGKPSEPLAKLSPNYVDLDYSDTNHLSDFVDAGNFDFLVPGCTDLSYEVCARINQGRFPGIASPEINDTINIKSKFRELAAKVGLSIPRVLSVGEAEYSEAVIVKPVDSFSGRGISVLHDPDLCGLEEALVSARRTSKTGQALIEEYVSGQLYSHSSFIHDGVVVADFIVREDCVANPFAVDTSQVIDDFPVKMLNSLRVDVSRLAKVLQLQDGLVHIQFISAQERYWIIEMNRRCPGDLYSLLIEYTTGFPYAASYAASFTGGQVGQVEPNSAHRRIIRHTASPKTEESLWGFSFCQPVDIQLYVPMVTSGERLGAGPSGRAGIFFFRTGSEAEQQELYTKLLQNELYTLN